MNKVLLLGHLGKDPELRSTQSGKAVANFSLATTEVYKDSKGEKQSKTTWHNIVVWSPKAEVVEKYLKKGSKVLVEGKIQQSDYTDKDGIKRYRTDINVYDFTMLDSKPKDEQDKSDPEPASTTSALNDEDDDLPDFLR